MLQEGFVHQEINAQGLGTITFGHPKSNSLPSKILYAIAEEITQLSSHQAVKIILLKSEGEKAFCAGASFDELLEIHDMTTARHFFGGFAAIIKAMKYSSKIIVTRVQGKATGGGVGIACASDYTIATEKADVCLSEINVGIGPFVIGPAVEHKIGKSAYIQMAIDASFKPALWAYQHNIYAHLLPDIAQLDNYVAQFLNTLLTRNVEALQLIKKIAWENTEHWDKLLDERIAMSSQLILTREAKKNIERIKIQLKNK